MKDGTEKLLKFQLLMSDLNLALWEVRGLLDSIWKFTRDNCPAGDIGRFDPADVCTMIGWNRTPPEVLFEALKKRRWIDDFDPRGSRVATVHDWPEHCELSVHRSLALKGLTFADGTEPNQSKMTKTERARAKKRRLERNAVAGGSQPEPEPEPSLATTKPEPEAGRSGSGRSKNGRSGDIDAVVVGDPVLFRVWIARERGLRHGIVRSDDHEQLAWAARAKSLDRDEGIDDPVAFVKSTLIEQDWSRVRGRHEDAGRAAWREASRRPPDAEIAAAIARLGLPPEDAA